MQITCPNCNKKYAIEPAQIGEMGRKVQCSQCKHIWFAKPTDLQEAEVTILKPEDKEIKTPEQPVKEQAEVKDENAKITEEVTTKTVHETIIKNLPVVIEQDVNREIKEALIRSQNLNGRLSTMLFATNVLILGLLIILILLLM